LNLDVLCFDVRDSGLIRLNGMFPVTGLTRELASGDKGKQHTLTGITAAKKIFSITTTKN
jgi:hypothetical protein